MVHGKNTILLLLSTGAVTGLGVTAEAGTWRVTPSITVAETYTDNVDLDATVQQSDFVTNVTPQIVVSGVGARLNTLVSYSANYFYYPGDDNDKHDLRHNLQANLNSELVRELFFIDSTASINQRFLDRRRAISANNVSRTLNRRTVQAYSFSPYLAHAFGTWATAQLRYDLRHVRQSADVSQTTADTFFGNSLSHQGIFSVSSGPRFTRLNWTASVNYRTEEREITNDFESTTARVDFSYQVNRMLALLGSAGYQDRETGSSFGQFDGLIWDAGFRLTPGPRSSLSFRYGNQFDGNTFSVNALYKITAKNTITLVYSDTLRTFQSLAFEEAGGTGFVPTEDSGFISGDLARRKRWTLGVNGVRGRTTYGINGFYLKNRSENSVLDEKRWGGGISLSRALNTRLTVGSNFYYNRSQFFSDNRKDNFWSASANASYLISKSLVGTLEYVHSDRDQSRFSVLNGGSNYVSLSIRASL